MIEVYLKASHKVQFINLGGLIQNNQNILYGIVPIRFIVKAILNCFLKKIPPMEEVNDKMLIKKYHTISYL